MHDRTALGAADVDDARLAGMVADAWGVGAVELLSSRAELVAYDIEALTTAGRHRVTGRARLIRHGAAATRAARGGRVVAGSVTAGGEAGFAFFVKVVQSWASPLLPVRTRGARRDGPGRAAVRRGAAGVPQRPGRPPAARARHAARVRVVDLDAESAALWLEDVPAVPTRWDRAALARAAHLLGRLAVSPRVRPLAAVADPAGRRIARTYAEGRLVRWVEERTAGGFRHGPRREGKLHPDLVDWSDLSEVAKDKDRAAVRNLPALLAAEGLYIWRNG